MQHDDDVDMYDEEKVSHRPHVQYAPAASSAAAAHSSSSQHQRMTAADDADDEDVQEVPNPRSQWGPPIQSTKSSNKKAGVKRTRRNVDDERGEEGEEREEREEEEDNGKHADKSKKYYKDDDDSDDDEGNRLGRGAGTTKQQGSQIVLKSEGKLTVREEEVAELVFYRFSNINTLVAALKKQGIADPKNLIGGSWNKGGLTAGSFLSNMFVKARDDLKLKQKIIYILTQDNILRDLANECGLEDEWIPMEGGWQAKPEILEYKESHPGAVVFSDVDPQHESKNYGPPRSSSSSGGAASASSSSSSSNAGAAAAASGGNSSSREYQSKDPLPDRRWPMVRYRPGLCVRDCGAGGDCLFKSIAWALNKKFGEKLTHRMVRALCADELTADDLDVFNVMFFQASEDDVQDARHYKKNKKKTAFTLEEMRKTLKTSGKGYQGDSSMLALLSRSKDERLHDTGFLIFEQDGTFYHLEEQVNKIYTHYLMLYHMTEMVDDDGDAVDVLHFQLAGWMNDKGHVSSILHLDEIPDPLYLQLCVEYPQHNLCSTK